LNGQLGNTRFGPLSVSQLQQYSRNWGIFEWHPLPYSSPSNSALYNNTVTYLGDYYNGGARVLFPGWWFKTGTPVNPIFPLPDSNFARGLKDWLSARSDSSLPTMAGNGVIASIVAPSSGTIVSNNSITLTAYATGLNSSATNVAFFVGGTSIGVALKQQGTRTWTLMWTNVLLGTNLVTAAAGDDKLNTVISLPIQLRNPPPASPTLVFVEQGNQLVLSWTGTGFTLQSAESLSNSAWIDVPGATNSPVTVTLGSASAFYRLRYP
jgi:hypothetical protein